MPSVNHKKPYKRYHWKVLPQGMKNSPTLCQEFVDLAIQPVRQQYPDAYIVHYMDDILISHSQRDMAQQILQDLTRSLTHYGLLIAPDKIQHERPLQYLGHFITDEYVTSQHLEIRIDKLQTLNDFQKLLGNINWIRPYLKLSTGELSPLFSLLAGDSHPKSPRKLTPEAIAALKKVERALSNAKVIQVDYTMPWDFLIIKTPYTPTGCLWQNGILDLPHSQHKNLLAYATLCALLIVKARNRSKEIFGQDMHNIMIPYSRKQFEYLLQEDQDWGIALTGFVGQILYHIPKHPILEFVRETPLIFPTRCSVEPLQEAIVLFTDGSSNGKAVIWTEGQSPIVTQTDKSSAQQTELIAVLLAFQNFPQPFNLYTDSKYVVGLFPTIETALLSGSSCVFPLLKKLQKVIQARHSKFFVGHIRGHSKLPGALAFGNDMADYFTKDVIGVSIEEAIKSHAFHHQNANALRLQFRLTREQARQIVKDCLTCPPSNHVPKMGVNPRGLKANTLWQMDVTHVPEFGKLCFVHVCIDTFSHAVYASARTGEAVRDVVQHLNACFAVLGKPAKIKTDNGPAYTSRAFAEFCAQWHIAHTTGIPYNPQGQAIIERAHQELKAQLRKLREANKYLSPQHLLAHTLFILNHVNASDSGMTRMLRHWSKEDTGIRPVVKWKDLLTGQWRGPDPLITSGRGYACVFPQDEDSPIWIPDRLIRPVNEPVKQDSEEKASPQENEADTKEAAALLFSGGEPSENKAPHNSTTD